MEFLFRDAKQHVGLGDCQSRKKEALDFHFNAKINRIVTNNLDCFDELIDYIDLKPIISNSYPGVLSEHPSENLKNSEVLSKQISKFLIKSGFYPNSQAIGGAKHIYLFSQQGYAMLCKLLKSDTAKQIYKQMVREYFKIAEMQQNEEIGIETIKKQGRTEAEKYWWQGKLTEIVMEGFKQNREEMRQNREEMNQLHLEVRDLKEEVKVLKKLSTELKKLSTTEKSKPLPKSNRSVAFEIKELETESFIHKKQVELLQKIVNEKAKVAKEKNRIWFEFKKQFEVTRYIHLPKARFEEALNWLKALNKLS